MSLAAGNFYSLRGVDVGEAHPDWGMLQPVLKLSVEFPLSGDGAINPGWVPWHTIKAGVRRLWYKE